MLPLHLVEEPKPSEPARRVRRSEGRELVEPVARVGLEDEPSECEAEGHNAGPNLSRLNDW